MSRLKHLCLSGALLATIGYATPALAVTTTRVVITQDQQNVPEARIQLFDADTGAEVRREEDEDEAGALFLLDGGRYRVVVDGETVQEISVTGTGSRTFNIDLPPSGTQPPGVQPLEDRPVFGTPEDWTAWIFFGPAWEQFPTAGTGVVRDGPSGQAPEITAGETDDTVRTIGIGGGVELPAGRSRIRIGTSYSEGDGRTVFDVIAASGRVAGIVYGQLSPGNSSGIVAPFGLNGDTEVNHSRLDAVTSLVLPHVVDSRGATDEGTTFDAVIFAGFTHLDRNHVMFASGSGTSGAFNFQFAQQRDQELEENYFLLGVGGELRIPLSEAVDFQLNATGAGYLRDTQLNSFELNTSNFGPTSDRNFTVEIDESESDFGFRGELAGRINVWISPTVGLFLGGSADYWSSVGAIFNPNTGDQVFLEGRTTELTSDDAWSWSAIVGINFRL